MPLSPHILKASCFYGAADSLFKTPHRHFICLFIHSFFSPQNFPHLSKIYLLKWPQLPLSLSFTLDFETQILPHPPCAIVKSFMAGNRLCLTVQEGGSLGQNRWWSGWKGAQGAGFVYRWAKGTEREEEYGAAGKPTPGWSRMALAHLKGFPSPLALTPAMTV